MKFFLIDCLIAPEAACPRLWPKAGCFFFFFLRVFSEVGPFSHPFP